MLVQSTQDFEKAQCIITPEIAKMKPFPSTNWIPKLTPNCAKILNEIVDILGIYYYLMHFRSVLSTAFY